MGVDRPEEAAAEHKKPAAQPPSPWDCGSPLYDALELASVHRVLDTHLTALPFARRPCYDDDVAVLAVGVVRRATARRRRRRRSAMGVAKAATRTGKAVLRSIICGRRLWLTARTHQELSPTAVFARAATASQAATATGMARASVSRCCPAGTGSRWSEQGDRRAGFDWMEMVGQNVTVHLQAAS